MGAAYGLKHLDIYPGSSNNHICFSMNFWYFIGIGYGLHAMDRPVVRIFNWKRMFLPTSVGDFERMLLSSFSSNEENFSLASCCICASCRIIDCFKLFCSVWNLDSLAYFGSSAGLYVVFEFSVLLYEILLTFISSISIGCNYLGNKA